MAEFRRFGEGRVVAIVFAAFIVLCVAPVRKAAAHAPLERQIADLTKRIEADPSNAGLFVRRGGVHRAHRDFRAAISDYEHARKLSPELRAVDLYLGQLYIEAGRAERALTYLDRFLERDPSNEEARAERGRALMMLGAPLEASLDFTCAVEAAARRGDPPPEYYLDRAQAQAAAGGDHLEEALRGLDEGMARLGPVVTLELAALDLELSLGRPQAALERLDRIASQSQRKESFLFQRGEILERAGQPPEACASYQGALEAMEALPPSKQRTPAMEKLRLGLKEALERIAGGEPSLTDRRRLPDLRRKECKT
jgi:tetratricopeptide (TPR) repeat protein